MRWFLKRKKKPKMPVINEKLINETKVLDKIEIEKVKGGKKNERIWNGCGGAIPQ